MNRVIHILFVSLTVASICSSCLKPELGEDGYTIYTIKKGNHKSSTEVKKFYQGVLTFEVKFDNSARYRVSNPKNENDVNKLYGFNDCNSGINNHDNSARFGWKYYYGNLLLYSYTYSNGARIANFLRKITIDSVYTCAIIIEDNRYIYKINDVPYDTVTRGCSGGCTKYYLYPYFGGDEVAPRDITIKIKDISDQ